MNNLIPKSLREGLHCFFCGTDKSVKYIKTLHTTRFENGLVSVCCCNTCAMLKMIPLRGADYGSE